jgi:hypothetical protein
MTDINPQWRLQAITEIYGECGVGWYYTIKNMWPVDGANGEVMAFVHLELYTKQGEHFSMPITGIGGSALVAKETAGLKANDEAYKMATTDALSVAMKQLGFGAEIYMGRWDGTKYKDVPESSKSTPASVWDTMPESKQRELQGIVDSVRACMEADQMDDALGTLHEVTDADEKIALWSRLDSKERAAIKKAQGEKK